MRSESKLTRSRLHQRYAISASLKVSRNIEAFLSSKNDLHVVAFYIPIQTEINILPAQKKIRELKKTLCLPIIVANGKPLKFVIWNEKTKLVEDKFKVFIPDSKDFVEPDLILCPLLSFDSRGYRLGYGGGFYDRTIAQLNTVKKVFTLGCAYSQQIYSETLPIGNFDKPLDAVVTEHGVTFF